MIILKDLGRVKMIELVGGFNIEEIFHFRRQHWNSFTNERVIFSLEQANFIGSSGLVPLLRDLNNLGAKNRKSIVLVGVKPEIRKLICGLKLNHFKIFESVPEALSDCLKA